MTSEEAIKWLDRLYTRADITDEYGDMEDMQPYEEALDMAAKALEQESILDKIRSEIEQLHLIGYAIVDGKREIASMAVLEILDKYKGEKRGKGMTDFHKYVNALRKCADEHKNDITSFGSIVVSDLCRDTAKLLEKLEKESEGKE